MNSSDVAYQQILAAWVSAGAAIVQAVGAIAAIIVAIQLARSSAKREREADVAATRRLEAADRAQIERDERAEQAQETRLQRAKNDVHNAIIQRVTSLGFLAADECQSEVDSARSFFSENTASVIGGFASTRLAELRESLPRIKEETGDIELLEALSDLQDRVRPISTKGATGPEYIAALQTELSNIFGCIGAVESLRRPEI